MICDIENLAINYETYGSGRPMVMLPGRPSDHGAWRGLPQGSVD